MAGVELNWATAKVKDGKLTVDLAGEIASDWKQSFEATITLLPGGDWGDVQVKKRTVRVSEVSPGSEEKLRHHLESVVEQANAAVRPPESEASGGADGEGGGPDGPDAEGAEDEASSADARMTASFRGFAEDAESAET
jgi:hypothetical protein